MDESTSMSPYYQKLQTTAPDVALRYNEKIKDFHLDPYVLSSTDLQYDKEMLPNIEWGDIYSYLVLTHNFYTKEQVKAYKSLQAYKYYTAGFVTGIGCKKYDQFILVVANVSHSQRLRVPQLKVWLKCTQGGDIYTGHCTCMAGLSEVCSHLGAALFTIEALIRNQGQLSVTDMQCQWKVGSTKNVVNCITIKEMDWGKSSRMNVKYVAVAPSDLHSLLEKVKNGGETAVAMRVFEPFATHLRTDIVEEKLPSLNDLYKKEYEDLTYDQLLQLSTRYENEIDVNLAQTIKHRTARQSLCAEWYTQRSGRITASRCKQVAKTSLERPSVSLLKHICYPIQSKFTSKFTEWGITHEGVALDVYKTKSNHTNVSYQMVGFIINPILPFFGASPDCLVTCSCCGNGCVEIKCPYTLKFQTLQEYVTSKSSCLSVNNNQFHLNNKHAYYYQIQMQMYICAVEYCDFVMWSPREYFQERVYKDENLWKETYPRLLQYHKKVVFPELFGRYFTLREGKGITETWCVCDETDNGIPMIKCVCDTCPVKWFHKQCIFTDNYSNYVCDTCLTSSIN